MVLQSLHSLQRGFQMPVYACVDNRDLIELEDWPNQTDREINGNSYRKLDLVFLAWITKRVEAALALRVVDLEALGSAVLFTIDCSAFLGHPDRLPAIPANYTKPDIAEKLGWVMEIDWEPPKPSVNNR